MVIKMLELYGRCGKDVEIISFDIKTMVVIVKDKMNDITYKGVVDSCYVNADQLYRKFNGDVGDVEYSLKISLREYVVIKNDGD